jgi:hypothetical protein
MSIPKLSEATSRRHASASSIERGEAYYRAGAVVAVTQRGQILQAEVEGSEVEPYDVHLTFDKGGLTAAVCSCPYDFSGYPFKTGRFGVGRVLYRAKFNHEFSHSKEDRPPWDFGATRPCGPTGIEGCDAFMKLCLSSSGCESRPTKGEPARVGSQSCASQGNPAGDA